MSCPRCTSLTSVTISNSVTSIGWGAFLECESLASVTIGNNVTIIGHSAFGVCTNLTSVTIPNSVTSIGARVFEGCTNLTNVKFEGTIAADKVVGSNIEFIGQEGSVIDIKLVSPFYGDLRDKYLAGGRGTYKTTTPVPTEV